MYLHVSSSDCKALYPKNECFDFQIALPEPLHFTDGDYEIALTELEAPKRTRVPYYVCSDLCEPSYARGRSLPVLRVASSSQTFPKPYYVRLSRRHITSFRIYLLNPNLGTPNLNCDETRFTLHIRKIL